MRRARSALLALPLLLAPLAGCGDDGLDVTAQLVRSVPEATIESETAQMAVEMSMPGVAGMDGLITAQGAVDFAGERGTLTFDLGPVFEASGQAPPPGTDMTVDVIFEGPVLWMRFPFLTEALGPEGEGKEWVRIDTAAAAEEMGVDLQQLQQLGGNDPRNQLAYLMGVSDDVEEVGEEEVRGTATTHYRATVRIQDVLDQLEEEGDGLVDREHFERMADQLGVEETVVDVWVDEEGRARRILQTFPAPPEAGGGEVHVQIELFDFGSDVEVVPPPDEITLDITHLAGGQGG
jgi:hypothetical protein